MNCLMALAPLLLFPLPHFGNTHSSTIFTEVPTSWNATLGDGHVMFQCRAQNADSITWRLNGSFLSQINPVNVLGIASGNVPTSSGFLYTLRIPTIAEYNNTVVECAAITVGRQNSSLSDHVVLKMQGLLAAVGHLRVYPQQTSILLAWIPPFSLDITRVDPDIWYCVEVFNVTTRRTPLTANCNVYKSEFDFTVSNPSPCDQFEFRVIPVNAAGNGNVSTVNGTFFEKPDRDGVNILVEVLSDTEMKLGINFSQPQDICSSQIFVVEIMNGISQALSVSHERTGLSTNVTNDTIPFNYHYDITIELGNAAGSINLTGDLSLFDVQTATVNSHSPGTVDVSCMFAKHSRALGCLVVLHPQNTSQTEMFAYAARDNSSAPTANISIHGVPKGSRTVLVFDGEQNGLLSTRAAVAQNVTVAEGGPDPMNSFVNASIQPTHNQICVRCPAEGETKGCVVIIHPAWNLESVESHIIQKSDRGCFHQPSGEYTVAVFGQSMGRVLQMAPLNVSVVSISEPTTSTSTTPLTTTAEPNLSVCAADCIAGTLFAIAVATMLAVVVVGTVLVMWRRRCGRWNSKYKINRPDSMQPEESNWDTDMMQLRYTELQTTAAGRTVSSPPPEYASVSNTGPTVTIAHRQSDHSQGTDQPPDSHYTDVEAFAGKTKYPSQDDRVQYSAVVPHAMEMQPEKDPRREPIPPLPLLGTGVGHYSSLHLNTLFTKLHPTVTTKWQKLGETLGIDEDLLDEIFTNNETEDECLRAVLEQWLQIHPTFEDLSDALQKIGEKQLAELLYSTNWMSAI